MERRPANRGRSLGTHEISQVRDLDAILDIKLPRLRRKERTFEQSLRDLLEARGIMFVKLRPTRRGFPDRLAIEPAGSVLFVECKRDEKSGLSPSQKVVHAELRDLGARVYLAVGPDAQRSAADIVALLRHAP